jgi:hypothetical protein
MTKKTLIRKFLSVKEKRELINAGQWAKVPSVTSGGKPHFWVKTTTASKGTILWNRDADQWEYTLEMTVTELEE